MEIPELDLRSINYKTKLGKFSNNIDLEKYFGAKYGNYEKLLQCFENFYMYYLFVLSMSGVNQCQLLRTSQKTPAFKFHNQF